MVDLICKKRVFFLIDRLSERISPQRKVLTATSVRRLVDGVDCFDFFGV